jgi:hypothetical protein
MAILKIMPEYGCFPIWIIGKEGFFENVDPAQLPISDNQKAQLHHYREQYDKTLNQDYPPDSGFASEKEAIEFEHSGIFIWQQLFNEIGAQYDISYYSVLENRVYTDIQQYQKVIAQKTCQ